MGAWIEITDHYGNQLLLIESHPSWVRGLK